MGASSPKKQFSNQSKDIYKMTGSESPESFQQKKKRLNVSDFIDSNKDFVIDIKDQCNTKENCEFSVDLRSAGFHEEATTAPNSSSSQTETNSNKVELTDFEFLKVIGKGTFGKVVLAKCKIDNQFYAVKCVRKIEVIRNKSIESIKTEKSILLTLNHNFIIKLKYTFQSSEKLFMAFEYCNGGELFFHLQRRKKFPENLCRFYAAEVYHAIKYLHENNIIYRDLKPENIILDKEGHIRLIDFGLAKADVSEDNLTYAMCGTNEYLPPEVINGEKYAFNFDWWTFGNLIYEMVYGFPAFTSDLGTTDLFDKIVNTEPQYDNSVSPEVNQLIQLLLHKDVERRISPEQIPYHPWFKDIDFELVNQKKFAPPFRPSIISDTDYANIDPDFLNEDPISPKKSGKIPCYDNFDDFSYF